MTNLSKRLYCWWNGHSSDIYHKYHSKEYDARAVRNYMLFEVRCKRCHTVLFMVSKEAGQWH